MSLLLWQKLLRVKELRPQGCDQGQVHPGQTAISDVVRVVVPGSFNQSTGPRR